MRFQRRIAGPVLLLLLLAWYAGKEAQAISSMAIDRSISISDSIEMIQMGAVNDYYFSTPPVIFSPDRMHFIVLTRKGDIGRNANDFSILLFDTAGVFRSSTPTVLVRMSSTSNRPGIDNIHWISNRVVAFLGSAGDSIAQVYSLDISTRSLSQRTHSKNDVVAFDSTADFSTLIYVAHPPTRILFDRQAIDHGYVVGDEYLAELVAGRTNDELATYLMGDEVFVQHNSGRATRVLLDVKPMPFLNVTLSPRGQYAIMQASPRHLPNSWKDYAEYSVPDEPGLLYVLIDTASATARPLIPGNNGTGAPMGDYALAAPVAWLSDGKSVVVSGILLPLDTATLSELSARKTTYHTLEVSAANGDYIDITGGKLELVAADPKTYTVFLGPHTADRSLERGLIGYRKVAGAWIKTVVTPRVQEPQVFAEQDLNTPPRLMAVSKSTHRRVLVFDPNPQLRQLKRARVEAIEWTGKDGHHARGGLYIPPSLTPGARVPLVIQTHGWMAGTFSMDGYSTAGYAAQALAVHGIAVVQMDENYGDTIGTEAEGPMQMNSYGALISTLSARGLIDPRRVGLMAWSRTGYGVRFALAFADYPIAAASINDGLDASYLQYLSELNYDDRNGPTRNLYQNLNGGDPFRGALPQWLERAPGFNLNRVHTPVRILCFGSPGYASVLENGWEWFVGLHHLEKPVELVMLPNAMHAPVRPSERLTAQDGNVDWFRFWLNDEEDPNPAKVVQYARWHELKRQQTQTHATGSVVDSQARSHK